MQGSTTSWLHCIHTVRTAWIRVYKTPPYTAILVNQLSVTATQIDCLRLYHKSIVMILKNLKSLLIDLLIRPDWCQLTWVSVDLARQVTDALCPFMTGTWKLSECRVRGRGSPHSQQAACPYLGTVALQPTQKLTWTHLMTTTWHEL